MKRLMLVSLMSAMLVGQLVCGDDNASNAVDNQNSAGERFAAGAIGSSANVLVRGSLVGLAASAVRGCLNGLCHVVTDYQGHPQYPNDSYTQIWSQFTHSNFNPRAAAKLVCLAGAGIGIVRAAEEVYKMHQEYKTESKKPSAWRLGSTVGAAMTGAALGFAWLNS